MGLRWPDGSLTIQEGDARDQSRPTKALKRAPQPGTAAGGMWGKRIPGALSRKVTKTIRAARQIDVQRPFASGLLA